MIDGVSPWRMASAIGLIVVLAGILLWQIVGDPHGDETSSDGVTANTAGPEAVSEEVLWIRAAQDALDAWALYATTGDLAVVEGVIDPDGPQFAQLVGESPTLVTSRGSYSFVLDEPSAVLRDGFPVVSASVVVSLDGEVLDHLAWNIHLKEREGVWMLWTVEER